MLEGRGERVERSSLLELLPADTVVIEENAQRYQEEVGREWREAEQQVWVRATTGGVHVLRDALCR